MLFYASPSDVTMKLPGDSHVADFAKSILMSFQSLHYDDSSNDFTMKPSDDEVFLI